ncbi:hypothetical protein GTY87_29875 [Streptomyces sp. SID7813]|uniref:Membrane protein n=6 Tax=Streptomyces TaxID=1883 RepID=O50508_STRCO|nr:secreted protein [Streptomyces lividans TK24]MYU45355.1 hypothetical protein [Streptomyces sp. SID7813]QFI45687.1 hypothetical protein FQ762_30170 [Streptomyces coelicolor A3(2)]THA99929.1 hypothetical protein E6R61_01290 [Streptomyces sp. LRa12]CAA15791.1 putative membrane protein [Streptomyces coelicolor A3(2)]
MRGADVFQGAGPCDPRFPPCASSPPPRRSAPLGTLEAAAPSIARRSPSADPHSTTGGRSPDSGVDMVTRKNATGRFGSAAAGMLLATAGISLAARRRRREAARMHERLLELEELAIRRQSLAHQQRMHWELLTRAIDDPSLAEVIDTYDKSIPAERRRQFFYANAWYVNLYHVHRAGLLDQEGLQGRLREFFQSPVFREYWEATRNMRAALDQNSDEARLGLVVDALAKDFEDTDTDEWWVVGTPPHD